jgi:chemotaxis protein CheD
MPHASLHESLGLPLGHVSIGDCAFAQKPMLLTTVLGSCVCATFHHPGRRIGGMFHAMLPGRGLHRHGARPCLCADLAVAAMLERFAAAGMAPSELVVKLFGGANTMDARRWEGVRDMLDVGRRNVESALSALAEAGLAPVASDVLGAQGRKLHFATDSGEVWMYLLTPGQTSAQLAAENAENTEDMP